MAAYTAVTIRSNKTEEWPHRSHRHTPLFNRQRRRHKARTGRYGYCFHSTCERIVWRRTWQSAPRPGAICLWLTLKAAREPRGSLVVASCHRSITTPPLTAHSTLAVRAIRADGCGLVPKRDVGECEGVGVVLGTQTKTLPFLYTLSIMPSNGCEHGISCTLMPTVVFEECRLSPMTPRHIPSPYCHRTFRASSNSSPHSNLLFLLKIGLPHRSLMSSHSHN